MHDRQIDGFTYFITRAFIGTLLKVGSAVFARPVAFVFQRVSKWNE